MDDLSMEWYLENARLHLQDMINNFEKSGKQKILLTMKPKFISSTDSNEKHITHKRDNIENMIGENSDEIVHELFDSLLPRY